MNSVRDRTWIAARSNDRRVQQSSCGRAAWTDGREKGTLDGDARDARVRCERNVFRLTVACNMPQALNPHPLWLETEYRQGWQPRIAYTGTYIA